MSIRDSHDFSQAVTGRLCQASCVSLQFRSSGIVGRSSKCQLAARRFEGSVLRPHSKASLTLLTQPLSAHYYCRPSGNPRQCCDKTMQRGGFRATDPSECWISHPSLSECLRQIANLAFSVANNNRCIVCIFFLNVDGPCQPFLHSLSFPASHLFVCCSRQLLGLLISNLLVKRKLYLSPPTTDLEHTSPLSALSAMSTSTSRDCATHRPSTALPTPPLV